MTFLCLPFNSELHRFLECVNSLFRPGGNRKQAKSQGGNQDASAGDPMQTQANWPTSSQSPNQLFEDEEITRQSDSVSTLQQHTILSQVGRKPTFDAPARALHRSGRVVVAPPSSLENIRISSPQRTSSSHGSFESNKDLIRLQTKENNKLFISTQGNPPARSQSPQEFTTIRSPIQDRGYPNGGNPSRLGCESLAALQYFPAPPTKRRLTTFAQTEPRIFTENTVANTTCISNSDVRHEDIAPRGPSRWSYYVDLEYQTEPEDDGDEVL
ncbi:hypothetical protein TWF788_006161 [Orbilia oligospora]|uniref:Uncharacterized protein n=1 Tax=Orbilia oligospora TaxID=2813651 RepID=A0A7C8Q4A0_ORBOL|nr:hypothetical protein TWF788_006161 [Orbilia oligospora]